ncbi:MAG TPA: hypothetical protein VGI81_15955 [Tepidisphaeraceae bacterium]|jgi:hypothetical protein
MQGVTTAIVGFIFVCLVYPHLVKHRPQFYSALGLVLLVILFDAIAHMATDPIGALVRVMYVFTALVQILAILILVLCVGGLSVRELAGEVARTVEVIRRGEDKPILVPLRGEQPRPREERQETVAAVVPPAAAPEVAPRSSPPVPDDSKIPLE